MEARLPWARRPGVWAGGLVGLGLALRLYHFLREPSVWHDEAALILNVIFKNFAELLGPLYHAEAAPPLFLWLERAVVLALGDGTYALRLLPFVASCLALVLLLPIANRVLRPQDVPYAVLLFACSDRLLWHACEAKPYALDVLAAVVLLGVFVWGRSWPLGRRFWTFGLLAPVTIFLCYPACFLYGGVLLALLPAVWRAKRPVTWVGFGLLAATVLVSFGVLALGPARAQRCDMMVHCWLRQFPNWQKPWTVPAWTFFSSLEVVRYCCKPIGQLLTGMAVVGAVCWWRGGRRDLVMLLTVPILLALAASYAWAYPYGGVRVIVYAAPALVLLVAAGFPVAFAWVWARTRVAAIALAVPLLATGTLALYRVAVPWQRADCAAAAAYILAQRRPDEGVTGNTWEYEYYFKHLGPDFGLMAPPKKVKSERVWVVLSGHEREDQVKLLANLPPGEWRPLRQREFTQTKVLLMERAE